MLILGSPFAFQPGTMLSAIERLGLTSGLKLCLDASDINSYSGSGQSWLDTSGNGYDFFRGTTSASQATDPTFNGVAGAQSSSEYWSFDGGDYFTLGQSNPAWVENIHKDNAQVTFAAWARIASIVPATQRLMGNFSSQPSFGFYVGGSGLLGFGVNNTSSVAFTDGTTLTVPTGVWTFLACAVDEGGNAIVMQVDGDQQTDTCTYSSPSSGSSAATVKIAADGDAAEGFSNGSRMANFSAWSSALSSSSLLAIYNATKAKYGH